MRRWTACFLLICACSDEASTQPGSGGPIPGPTNGVCTGKPMPQADSVWMLNFGGMQRQFRVHLPTGYDPSKATPLVLNFHGYDETADEQAALSGMSPHADAHGYIAVYPTGTGNPVSWNAGNCCADALANHIDDVGFVGAMLDQLESQLCVDPQRVFATGMSNGGMMAHHLACVMSDRIAAVAPVAGPNMTSPCTPPRSVPVLHFHGNQDPVVSYTGNPAYGFPDVPTMMSAWAERDHCAQAATSVLSTGDTSCAGYPGCSAGAEVILCTIDGGGHTWPGGLPVPSLGKTTTAISATDMMWDFFSRHPM